MNSLSVSNPAPVVSLFGRAVLKARIPGQRHRNRATIAQINDQAVFRNDEVLCYESYSNSFHLVGFLRKSITEVIRISSERIW